MFEKKQPGGIDIKFSGPSIRWNKKKEAQKDCFPSQWIRYA